MISFKAWQQSYIKAFYTALQKGNLRPYSVLQRNISSVSNFIIFVLIHFKNNYDMKTINFTPSQLDTFSQTVLLIENFDIYENDYISGVQDYLQELEDNNELNEEQKSLLQLLTNHVTQN